MTRLKSGFWILFYRANDPYWIPRERIGLLAATCREII
jgi:hypothetical protein